MKYANINLIVCDMDTAVLEIEKIRQKPNQIVALQLPIDTPNGFLNRLYENIDKINKDNAKDGQLLIIIPPESKFIEMSYQSLCRLHNYLEGILSDIRGMRGWA